MSPIYEYECLTCQHKFEDLRLMDSDPDSCPECGGEIQRLISKISDAAPTGFSSRRKEPAKVLGESGKLGQKVSETDERMLEKDIRSDSRGRPKMTPTRSRSGYYGDS